MKTNNNTNYSITWPYFSSQLPCRQTVISTLFCYEIPKIDYHANMKRHLNLRRRAVRATDPLSDYDSTCQGRAGDGATLQGQTRPLSQDGFVRKTE